MKFVIRPRRGGKTYAAVDWLLEDPGHRVILTSSAGAARDLQRRYALTDRQVMCAPDAQLRLRGRNVTVAVEDLDTILAQALGLGPVPVALVTATGESA